MNYEIYLQILVLQAKILTKISKPKIKLFLHNLNMVGALFPDPLAFSNIGFKPLMAFGCCKLQK